MKMIPSRAVATSSSRSNSPMSSSFSQNSSSHRDSAGTPVAENWCYTQVSRTKVDVLMKLICLFSGKSRQILVHVDHQQFQFL